MKIAKSLSAAALYVVAIAWPVAAYAGSAASYDCSLTKQTIFASTTLVPMSDLGVTVDLGSNQTYQVQLSADICVSYRAEVRVAYSVDGQTPQVFGPTNLANHQEYCETRATLAVIPLSAGTHTLTPYWLVSGAAGKQATIVNGCMVALQQF
jgi:hypothetical protein